MASFIQFLPSAANALISKQSPKNRGQKKDTCLHTTPLSSLATGSWYTKKGYSTNNFDLSFTDTQETIRKLNLRLSFNHYILKPIFVS